MVITKKSPLSILNHLRVINLTCLKQRFNDCLFQVSLYLYNIYNFYFIIFQNTSRFLRQTNRKFKIVQLYET